MRVVCGGVCLCVTRLRRGSIVLELHGALRVDASQHWQYWKQEQYEVARESTRSQVRRMRRHPSMLVFLYSSDQLPPADVEQMYLSVFAQEHWPNPVLASASNYTSNITGPTGVKMSGPYAVRRSRAVCFSSVPPASHRCGNRRSASTRAKAARMRWQGDQRI